MKVFVELKGSYLHLHYEKPNVSKDSEVREMECPKGLDGNRVWIGLTVAEQEGKYGYGVTLADTLEEVFNMQPLRTESAIKDLENKINLEEYRIKQHQYLMSPTHDAKHQPKPKPKPKKKEVKKK